MLNTIVSLDMEMEQEANFKSLTKDEFEFENFTDEKSLILYIETVMNPLIVVLDIDTNTQEKYLLSQNLSKRSNTYMIFLTSETDCKKRVLWFLYGAYEYIFKPYDELELLLRSQKIADLSSKNIIQDKNFHINQISREIRYHGNSIFIAPKMFDMILYFVTNPGKTISREELMKGVFKTSQYLSDRSIDTHIKKIRKITDYNIIETVHGEGYLYKQ